MIAQTPCPCCGHIVSPDKELCWIEGSRTLSGRGHIVTLTPMQTRIFNKLWKCWPSGRSVTLVEMMDHVYADRIDGGPESHNSVSVQMNNLRKRVAPLGLRIKGRYGYLICQLDAERAAA